MTNFAPVPKMPPSIKLAASDSERKFDTAQFYNCGMPLTDEQKENNGKFAHANYQGSGMGRFQFFRQYAGQVIQCFVESSSRVSRRFVVEQEWLCFCGVNFHTYNFRVELENAGGRLPDGRSTETMRLIPLDDCFFARQRERIGGAEPLLHWLYITDVEFVEAAHRHEKSGRIIKPKVRRRIELEE